MKYYKDKNILIIGGTGSIGSALFSALLLEYPNFIRIYSRDEAKQFDMQQKIKGWDKTVRYLIGDIRDKDRLRMAMDDVDIVFHCAALKHVPACEYNPFEAVKTNVIGTQNIIDICIEKKVRKMIYVSTDKAVNPVSSMGVSKLMAERLVMDASAYSNSTLFSIVRFGNVLGSRGSILPIIKWHCDNNIKVPLTDEKMTRYFMRIEDAVNLIAEVGTYEYGTGNLYVLKMKSMLIKDLINVYMRMLGSDVGIKLIGLRDGEKLHEELLTSYELEHTKNWDESKYCYHKDFIGEKIDHQISLINTISQDEIRKMLL